MTQKQKNPLTKISTVMIKLIMLSYGHWLYLHNGNWHRIFLNPEQHNLLLSFAKKREFAKFWHISEEEFFAIADLPPLL